MNKPVTPLPWFTQPDDHYSELSHVFSEYKDDGSSVTLKGPCIHSGDYETLMEQGDANYIVHACNAYPKLIEMVELIAKGSDLSASLRAIALLRELGELK